MVELYVESKLELVVAAETKHNFDFGAVVVLNVVFAKVIYTVAAQANK